MNTQLQKILRSNLISGIIAYLRSCNFSQTEVDYLSHFKDKNSLKLIKHARREGTFWEIVAYNSNDKSSPLVIKLDRGNIKMLYLTRLWKMINSILTNDYSTKDCAIFIFDAITDVQCKRQRIFNYQFGTPSGIYLTDTEEKLIHFLDTPNYEILNPQNFFAKFGEFEWIGNDGYKGGTFEKSVSSISFKINGDFYEHSYKHFNPESPILSNSFIAKKEILLNKKVRILTKLSETNHISLIKIALSEYIKTFLINTEKEI